MKMASLSYQPVPRYCHISACINEKVIVYSGESPKVVSKQLASTVDVFDIYKEEWHGETLTGQTPSTSLYRAASCSQNTNLYFFGGTASDKFKNGLFKISNEDSRYRCSKLSGFNADGCPMPKFGAGLVDFGNNLGVFGGYGKPRRTQPRSSFIEDNDYYYYDGRGWTNEFHVFNLKEGLYSATTVMYHTC